MENQFLLLPEVQAWIHHHLQEDVAKLALKSTAFPKDWMPHILEQLQSKQKAAFKLPTWYQANDILYPKGISVEQTSSEKAASFKSTLIQGNVLVDVTGGFGVDAYYFSQVFSKVYHVEQQEALSAVVKCNFDILGRSNIQCVAKNSRDFLKEFSSLIDVIYADPARRDDQKNKVFLLEDCEPNVLEELDFWLQKAKQVLLKTSPMLDISLGLSLLNKVAKIWIITIDNEVKELLWLLQNEAESPELEVVHLYKNQTNRFSIPWNEVSNINFQIPQKYLYEPHAGWMKSGKMDVYAAQLGLSKLAPHSHVYTSEFCLEAFHGRVFEVLCFHPYEKSWMKQHLQGNAAAITVRNFPEKAEELRKKWKIKESNQQFVFFTTLHNQQKIVLICKKIAS